MKDEEFVIGSIRLSDYEPEIETEQAILEYAHVDLGRNLHDCKVIVKGKEGMIPHFHIEAVGFLACIYIFEPKYFNHNKHQDTLDKDQLERLNYWLSTIDPIAEDKENKGRPLTYWENICLLWKLSGNPLRLWKHYTQSTQPDYRHPTLWRKK